MISYIKSEEEFRTVIQESCIVDFFANWCGPCKAISPILEEIDLLPIYKVDVDLFPNIAKEYGIMSIPTLCFFKNREIQGKLVGLKNKEEIINEIKKLHIN